MNMLLQAEFLVKQGWYIVPIWSVDSNGHCCCGNSNCTSSGKHPIGQLAPNGLKNASDDLTTIKKWLESIPDINLGVCTGTDSGIIVLDIDPVHGGEESLSKLVSTYGPLPQTATVTTGSGGRHFYFKHPGHAVKNSASKLGAGVDIKADGGYVVAPPSMHKTGKSYEWSASPDTTPVAPAPDWLLNLVKDKPVAKTTPTTSIAPVTPIPQGERNNALASFAGTLRKRGLVASEIAETLMVLNLSRCSPPLDRVEVEQIAQSIGKYPAAETTITFALTDLGNSERLVHYYGNRLRFNHETGKWLYYDEVRWNPVVGNAAVVILASDTVRKIIAELNLTTDQKNLISWAHSSESERSIKAMLNLSRAMPPFASYLPDFDKDPYLLNCINGTINLKTGMLQAHNPADMITKLAPIRCPASAGDAKCDLWLRCLNRWMSDDQEVISYLQQLGGMCLTGDTSSRVFPIFWGVGKNGKSVFLDTIMELMGDYATPAPDGFLADKTFDTHPTEIADLFGKRLVVAAETKKNMKLRTALVKAHTGDTRLKGRFMRQDYFSFPTTHKIILMTQNLPIIDETSDAIWDRVHALHWKVRIPDNEQDTRLMEKLKQECPGIMAWLVQGCLMWQQVGRLKPTASIVQTNREYREDEDLLKEFIEQTCIFGADLFVPKGRLRNLYDQWAEANSVKYTLGERSFNAYLREKGCKDGQKRIENKNLKCWFGIGLQSQEMPTV